MAVELKKETIEGQEVTFFVNEDGGFFARTPLLESYDRAYPNIAEARTKIRGMLRRATTRLEIKAHSINELSPEDRARPWHKRHENVEANKVRPVTITGIATRNNNVLVTYEDSGEKENHGRGGSFDQEAILTRRLTSDEIKTYGRLFREMKDSEAAFKSFVESVQIQNPEEYVAKAIEDAINARAEAGDIEEDADQRTAATAPKKTGRVKRGAR